MVTGHAAERDLADFFDNGALPLHWVDGAGRIVRANRAELELLGYLEQEYIGRPIADFHVDADVIADILARLKAGQTLRNYPARLRCRDGGVREVLITSNVLRDEDGGFVHTRCFTVDVTDRKRIEVERAQTADYLEGLMEGFVAYDRSWVMTYMNGSAERLLDRRRADVLGKTWHQAFPHAVGNPVDHMYQAVMRTRTAKRMEYHYRHYGKWLEIAASPVRDGGVAVYFRDISDRVRANEALRLSEQEAQQQVRGLTRLHEFALQLGGIGELRGMLDAALRAMADFHGAARGLVFLVDAESGTLEVAGSLGMDPETLARMRRIAQSPDAGACAFVARGRVIVEDTEADGRFLAYRDHARAAGFRAMHSTPIVNRAGHVLGVISVHFDSPRRPSPLEIQLADMCARHTADAIELVRVIEELRNADRRKDEFLATLAHELRNPLAPISNGLHILRLNPGANETASQTQAMMERQTRHLVRLVEDLLDLSRIRTGKLQLRLERVAIGTLMANAVEASRPFVDAKGHALVVELPSDAVLIEADGVRICQVFGNLLNNAAKFTPPGGTLRFSAERDGDAVVVRIADNGIGIPSEMLGKLFERYVQLAGAEQERSGLGLGLSLVKTLVEMHGGSVGAASEGTGRGSVFWVRLPLSVAPAPRG